LIVEDIDDEVDEVDEVDTLKDSKSKQIRRHSPRLPVLSEKVKSNTSCSSSVDSRKTLVPAGAISMPDVIVRAKASEAQQAGDIVRKMTANSRSAAAKHDRGSEQGPANQSLGGRGRSRGCGRGRGGGRGLNRGKGGKMCTNHNEISKYIIMIIVLYR